MNINISYTHITPYLGFYLHDSSMDISSYFIPTTTAVFTDLSGFYGPSGTRWPNPYAISIHLALEMSNPYSNILKMKKEIGISLY